MFKFWYMIFFARPIERSLTRDTGELIPKSGGIVLKFRAIFTT